MKKFISILALALLAITSAAADTISVGQTVTYNYSLNSTSGTLTATATFTLNSTNSMTVSITNTSPSNSWNSRPALTAIGFNTTPTLSLTGLTALTSNVSQWHVNGNTGIGNYEISAGDAGVCNQGPPPGSSLDNNNPNGDALCVGNTGSFTLTFSGLSPTANGFIIDASIVKFQTEIDSYQVPGGGNQVPEPASLALLGTGLLSAGGFLRRKLNK